MGVVTDPRVHVHTHAGDRTLDRLGSRPAANLLELLAVQAQRNPNGVAILAPRREPLSFAALLDQIGYIRTMLDGCGLGRGDRIALLAGRGPDTAVAVVGIASSATCIPLNAAATPAEVEHGLVQTLAKALLVPAGASTEVKEVAARVGIPLLEHSAEEGAPAGKFQIQRSQPAAVARSGSVIPSDIALVLRTSGTTARAKIVPLSHGNIVARADKACRMLGLSPADRCLNLMPLCYNHGLNNVMSSLSAGCAVICPPGFDFEMFLACMRDFSPTFYTASFTYHHAILEWLEQRPNALDGNQLRFVRSGSGPLRSRVRADLEKILGAPVLEYYGTTETGAIAANSPDGLRKPGMVGRSPDNDVAIMDSDGNLLAPGEEGEVVVRGSTVFGGYENDPAANERVFRDGWYCTGEQRPSCRVKAHR